MFETNVINPDDFQAKAARAAGLLKSMGNEHRLMVLCRLGTGEQTVSQLLTATELSQSALSQHLAVLRDGGLVATRREGQTVHYRLADPAVTQVIRTLITVYCPEMLK